MHLTNINLEIYLLTLQLNFADSRSCVWSMTSAVDPAQDLVVTTSTYILSTLKRPELASFRILGALG